jgi:hypothetical protein
MLDYVEKGGQEKQLWVCQTRIKDLVWWLNELTKEFNNELRTCTDVSRRDFIRGSLAQIDFIEHYLNELYSDVFEEKGE